MAFIFNPNPSEGDKQTNPDTGVEYIYSGGAWRALGPKIEDEFDTLDDRYIKLNGRSDVGDGYTIKGPGITDGATSTFHQIKDGKQYLYHVDTPQDSNTEWVANVSYVKSKTDDKMTKQGTQNIEPDHWKIIQKNQSNANRTFIDIYDGEMNLYNVADPTDGADGWAANKGYVDDLFSSTGGGSYLPLAGGDLTGKIDITLDSPGNAAIRTIGSINVKSDGQGIGGSNNFIAHKDYVRVFSTPVAANDVTHKGFTDSTYRKKTAIPGLIFGYESGGSGTVATGKFRWYTDGGGKRLKINATTKDGIPWGVDTPVSDINYSEGHMFTIYTTVSNTNNWRIKQTGTINRIDFHSNDILCYVSFSAENGSFSTSAEYGIKISGLF